MNKRIYYYIALFSELLICIFDLLIFICNKDNLLYLLILNIFSILFLLLSTIVVIQDNKMITTVNNEILQFLKDVYHTPINIFESSEEFKKQNIKEVDNSQSEYYKMISDVISVIFENQKR